MQAGRLSQTLNLYGFEPDAARAAVLDRNIRQGLIESLNTVFDSLPHPVDEGRRRALIAAVDAAPVEPTVFGTYVELVMALFDERTADAGLLVDELLHRALTPTEPLRIVGLDDAELGVGQADRYRRLVTDDVLVEIGPAPQASVARAKQVLETAFDLLRTGAPEVFAEVGELIREIVLVEGRCAFDHLVVGGAVTFALWGAQVMVADQVQSRLGSAIHLAHEATHNHLFGMAIGGRLVENDDADRFPSPLRPDARPLEGVAHATYVMARMALVFDVLIASGQLTMAELAEAREQAARNRNGFRQGFETVMRHADFTPAGRAAFEDVQRYMAERV